MGVREAQTSRPLATAPAQQLRRGREVWTTRLEEVKGQRGHEGPSGLGRLRTLDQKGLFTQRPTRSRPRPRVNY